MLAHGGWGQPRAPLLLRRLTRWRLTMGQRTRRLAWAAACACAATSAIMQAGPACRWQREAALRCVHTARARGGRSGAVRAAPHHLLLAAPARPLLLCARCALAGHSIVVWLPLMAMSRWLAATAVLASRIAAQHNPQRLPPMQPAAALLRSALLHKCSSAPLASSLAAAACGTSGATSSSSLAQALRGYASPAAKKVTVEVREL